MSSERVLRLPVQAGRSAAATGRAGAKAPAVAPAPAPARPEPLWRDLVGAELRARRRQARRTLADVAEHAGISTQYLSEVERGLKEPSSEILGAVHGALGLRLADLTGAVTRRLEQSPIRGALCLAA